MKWKLFLVEENIKEWFAICIVVSISKSLVKRKVVLNFPVSVAQRSCTCSNPGNVPNSNKNVDSTSCKAE